MSPFVALSIQSTFSLVAFSLIALWHVAPRLNARSREDALVPLLFSCRGRSLCPSYEKKTQLLWAEWLQKEVLEPVPHRHVVLTMRRLLRGVFRKRMDTSSRPTARSRTTARFTRSRHGTVTRS